MGGTIDVVESDKHLGNIIGNENEEYLVNRCVVDFMSRVNMVKHHFTGLPVDAMYALFKTYCMPLYGSQLLDLSHRSIEKLYIAWRKAIRYLFNLPHRTHSVLLPLIVGDDNVQCQLHKRFIQFYKSLYSSDNTIISLCARLAEQGSRSAVANSLTSLCF